MDRIVAAQAEAEDMGNYLQVAFGMQADRYVIVQLAKQFDAQDRESGMDGIYLEIDDQSRAACI